MMLNLLTSWILLTCCQLRTCGNVEFLLIPEKVYCRERISPGVFKKEQMYSTTIYFYVPV